VDGSDNDGRRVEGVEGGALGAVVFRWAQQRFQLLAQSLPCGILVFAGDRIGEDGEGDRAESGEAGEYLLFLRSGKPLFLLDFLEGANGGDYVAGFGFFTAGEGRRRLSRKGGWRVGRVAGFDRRWSVCDRWLR
jgi:hypothetical protein